MKQDLASSRSASFSVRNIAVVLLLVTALLVAYSAELTPNLLGQAIPTQKEITYIADLDYWQRTNREVEVVATERFDLDSDLSTLPLSFGDWSGEVAPETNAEVMILLDPEQYEQRLYYNSQGQHIWLSLIGGRSSQPFHAPDICYDADGWQYNLSSAAIPLQDGGEIHGLWMDARKTLPGESEEVEHIVFYFYLFPNRAREHKDGIVLFKLTSGRYDTIDETRAVHADFVRNFFTHSQSLR